ncbi:hypothetical protein BGX28_007452 [Mortierella sp. GBA30]|nr:hypothetical protein BGX28_007452 [Mortierella sp. GBA30]
MASFKESATANGAGAGPSGTSEDESFTFVTRKKNGRRQDRSLTTMLPQPVARIPMANEGDMVKPLPGWSTKKPSKVKKNSQRARMLGSRGADPEERTLEWGLSMMEDRIMALKHSRFYEAFRDLVQLTLYPPCENIANKAQEQTQLRIKSLEKLSQQIVQEKAEPVSESTTQDEHGNTVDQKEGSETLTLGPEESRHCCESPVFKDMICYGIGSIESSRNSQFQLALGLCLKEILKVSGTISIFDPAMTEYDQRLVEKLGMDVLKVNDQAKQAIETRTLLYMPHCPKGLYSHVLESNWSREQLDRLVILGNRFTMYDESPSFRQFARQAPFILPALSIADVCLLPAVKFEDNTIFNDLALHSFPSHCAVPEVDVQQREQDPELL